MNWMPDEMYLKLRFWVNIGKRLNLKNPQTFNEKLQWLKLYDRNSEYTKMVDKYEVREYIKEKIGEEYLIPLLGVWDKFDDINFDLLPNQFVLKCTHDSGGLIICKDKSQLDIKAARKKINKCLKRNFYYLTREWPYKNVRPRIVAEKFMVDESGKTPRDYKVHNFNGEPEFVLVCDGRFDKNGMKEDFYDVRWKHMDIKRPGNKNSEILHKKPQNFEKMLSYSKFLSKGIPFVRNDFYEIEGKIYFGEITFFPASGFKNFEPEEWDFKFGKMIKL